MDILKETFAPILFFHFNLFSTVCEYFAHVECQDFAVPDCKENATYVPSKELSSFKHQVNNRIMLLCQHFTFISNFFFI